MSNRSTPKSRPTNPRAKEMQKNRQSSFDACTDLLHKVRAPPGMAMKRFKRLGWVVVEVLRGPSGSGKSICARQKAQEMPERAVVISTHTCHSDHCDYAPSFQELEQAHIWCRFAFASALKNRKVGRIIVDDVNLLARHALYYVKKAEEARAYRDVVIQVTEMSIPIAMAPKLASRCRHAVSYEAIERQIRDTEPLDRRRGVAFVYLEYKDVGIVW